MRNFLQLAEQKALRAILRDYTEKWVRVGERPYAFGEEGNARFDGSELEFGMMIGLHSVPEINNPNLPTPLLTGQRPEVVRYRRRTWRAGVRYLWEDTIDDKIGWYKRLTRNLSGALEYSVELLWHEPFFRAIDPNYIGGWDRKTLLNDTHDLLGGGTFDNRRAFATPTDAIIRQIEEHFNTIPDPYGRPVAINNIMIYTSTKWYLTFQQILNSRTAITNPLASGQVNPNQGIVPAFTAGRFTVVASPYLTGVNNGDVYFALGQNHNMFKATAFAKDRMYEINNPPGYVHETWWSGGVGWLSAESILGYI